MPSERAPSFTLNFEPGAGPVALNTSLRVMTILTGRPALAESFTASGSR